MHVLQPVRAVFRKSSQNTVTNGLKFLPSGIDQEHAEQRTYEDRSKKREAAESIFSGVDMFSPQGVC